MARQMAHFGLYVPAMIRHKMFVMLVSKNSVHKQPLKTDLHDLHIFVLGCTKDAKSFYQSADTESF